MDSGMASLASWVGLGNSERQGTPTCRILILIPSYSSHKYIRRSPLGMARELNESKLFQSRGDPVNEARRHDDGWKKFETLCK